MNSATQEKRARVTRYVLIVVGVLIALTLTGFPARILSSYEVNERVSELEQRLAELKKERTALTQELGRRRTDAYVRITAIEKLGLVAPGEELMLLPRDPEETGIAVRQHKADEPGASPVPDPADGQWGYLSRWLNLLRQTFS